MRTLCLSVPHSWNTVSFMVDHIETGSYPGRKGWTHFRTVTKPDSRCVITLDKCQVATTLEFSDPISHIYFKSTVTYSTEIPKYTTRIFILTIVT